MSELTLAPTSDSVPVARRFARSELRESGCDVDTAVLLVSEVVTNAVLHARSAIRLRVEGLVRRARIEVADSSGSELARHDFTLESTTGRGLRMLDQLALRWGVVHVDGGSGKVVWFEVGAPSETTWTPFSDALLDGFPPTGSR